MNFNKSLIKAIIIFLGLGTAVLVAQPGKTSLGMPIYSISGVQQIDTREINEIALVMLNEGFEGTLDNWLTADEDGDGDTWGVYEEADGTEGYAHSGARGIGINWNTTGNNDWIITPQIAIPSNEVTTFSFWAHSLSPAYLENFNVKLSNSTTSIADFSVTLEAVIDAPNAWTQYTFDLSSYAGQSLYLAIQCVSVDEYYLFADDFLVETSGTTPTLSADFSADNTSGEAPLTVQFTDASLGSPTGWSWDFNNDGTEDANTQNPSYTYTDTGSYTVVLTVSDGTDSDTATKTDYIAVNAETQIGTWSSITSDASDNFKDVYFIGDIGWAVGDLEGKIFKTIDKGESWNDGSTDNAWGNNEKVWFTSPTTGFIVKNFGGWLSAPATGEIKRTTDGGATWSSVFLITDYEIEDIAFADANNGWAVTYYHIYKTTDGGINWAEHVFDSEGGVYDDISIIDANNVHISTGLRLSQPRIIVKTSNGGTDWEDVIVSGTTNEFLDIHFETNTLAWASGWSGKIYKTIDGLNWTVTETGHSGGLNRLDFVNNLQGIAVGASGLILRTEDGGSTWAEDEITNPGLSSIFYIDNANAVAVGHDGTILKYSSGSGEPTRVDQNNHYHTDLPQSFSLKQNFPNPFNPSTQIRYELFEQSNVSIHIYDIRGIEMYSYYVGMVSAGAYELQWGGVSNSGLPLSGGMYLLKLNAANESKTIKMLLLK